MPSLRLTYHIINLLNDHFFNNFGEKYRAKSNYILMFNSKSLDYTKLILESVQRFFKKYIKAQGRIYGHRLSGTENF